MEDILDLYCQPYAADYPVICMDEKPYQLLDQVRNPIPMTVKHPLRQDSEYVRKGTCSIFVFTEPLTGWCCADASERRTRQDWAQRIHSLVTEHYPHATKIGLVMDNLNTHAISSLYQAFKPEIARQIAKKLEIHYTPKHGSWLNAAEIQIGVLSRQCLNRRIPSLDGLNKDLSAWQADHNSLPKKIHWQFTSSDARINLHRLYPYI